MIAGAKAAQWFDRDQPEIAAEKFRLRGWRDLPAGEILHAAAADPIGSVCPRRASSTQERTLCDSCFMKANCNVRLVKTIADRTWIIARTRNTHCCDAHIFGM
jgi:hypothetical protein